MSIKAGYEKQNKMIANMIPGDFIPTEVCIIMKIQSTIKWTTTSVKYTLSMKV